MKSIFYLFGSILLLSCRVPSQTTAIIQPSGKIISDTSDLVAELVHNPKYRHSYGLALSLKNNRSIIQLHKIRFGNYTKNYPDSCRFAPRNKYFYERCLLGGTAPNWTTIGIPLTQPFHSTRPCYVYYTLGNRQKVLRLNQVTIIDCRISVCRGATPSTRPQECCWELGYTY